MNCGFSAITPMIEDGEEIIVFENFRGLGRQRRGRVNIKCLVVTINNVHRTTRDQATAKSSGEVLMLARPLSVAAKRSAL